MSRQSLTRIKFLTADAKLFKLRNLSLHILMPGQSRMDPANRSRTAQNIKERPASKCLAPQRRAKGTCLSGHAMACSLWDSLQGPGVRFRYLVQPYEPASLFPLGAGHIGHWEAPLLQCNFSRITLVTLRCKPRTASFQHRSATF